MRVIATLALTLASFTSQLHARDTSIAVVVNPRNSVESISLAELRNIFLGTQAFWKDGTPVVAIVRAPSARERDVMLRRLVHMTEAQYQQYWRKQRQSPKNLREPMPVLSNGMQAQMVLRDGGAIALLPISDIHSGVKVLKVGGHLPGSAAYPLKTSSVR
jgi:hypothetical protein